MRNLLVILPVILASAASAQDHFIDVRSLVRDTLDAIKEVPQMMKNQSSASSQSEVSTSRPEKAVNPPSDVYDTLLSLPADIMSQLARDAGFVNEKEEKAQGEAEVTSETNREEVNRIEKKKEDEESYSFKTVDDMKAIQQKEMNERRPTPALKKQDDNEDIFSISKLISATGNAIRQAQAVHAARNAQKPQLPQQEPMITLPPLVPLPPVPFQMPIANMPSTTVAQPATEIMYRPVTKDGKTIYEQVVVLKEANGSLQILPNGVLPQLPQVSPSPSTKRVEIKKMKSALESVEFSAPTFPPMVNVFTEASTTTSTTTEVPEVTTTKMEAETVKPKRKALPKRKIHYLEKKEDMHERQFGAKTVQMSDPIEIQAQDEQEPINVLQKEGSIRVYTINRKRDNRKRHAARIQKIEAAATKVVEEKQEEATEPPKKKRKIRKSHKSSKKENKEVRKFPDLYEEQFKTQVAPSVSPLSEEFAEQFDGVDELQVNPAKKDAVQPEPQNDSPVNDAIEQRSSKVQMLTKEQEEDLLNKEIRKRVLQKIRLSKVKSTTTTTTTTTEVPETASEAAEEVVQSAEQTEENDDVIEAEELTEDEEEEEEVTTTTTTEAPVTRARRVKKNKKRAVVTKHQCLNLRSFAKQFLFDTVEDFVKEHCYFIENYYPALTCVRAKAYVEKCQKWLKE